MRQNAILQRKKKCYLKEINLQTIQKRTCKAFCLQSKNIQYMCATHTYLIFFCSGKFLFSQKEKQSQSDPGLISNSNMLQASIHPYFLLFALHLQPMPTNYCQELQLKYWFNKVIHQVCSQVDDQFKYWWILTSHDKKYANIIVMTSRPTLYVKSKKVVVPVIVTRSQKTDFSKTVGLKNVVHST